MKNIFIVSFTLISLNAHALISNFDSTVDGLSIPNAHVLSANETEQPLVVRGMAPNFEQVAELREIGIQRVIIFKNETKTEVQSEITNLVEAGFAKKDIIHIPFLWQDLHDFHEACTMSVKALSIITKSEVEKTPVFFHCTVGEDRTGYLAGLYNIWNNSGLTTEQVFKQELCARGYEAGNKKKPAAVVNKIRDNLTPTFVKMAKLLKQWKSKGLNLDPKLCPDNVEIENQTLKCARNH